MGILLFIVTRHFDILPISINYFRLIRLKIIILLNFTALVCFTRVLGFMCAGLREKVPQIARISVWDFSGFGGFQSLLAAMYSGIPQMREYLEQKCYREYP